jgi:Uma2 family endonuclease
MVQTELTLDDLEQMPDDFVHRELVNGELIELPPPLFKHSEIAHNIYDSLSPFAKQRHLGSAFIEAGYKITSDKRNFIEPDVSFVSTKRLDEDDKYLFGAPDLAIEVISPSERPKHVLAKRAVLFENGCKEIWIVRPKTRKIEVWTPRGMDRVLGERDTLSSALFDGWSMLVAEIFA